MWNPFSRQADTASNSALPPPPAPTAPDDPMPMSLGGDPDERLAQIAEIELMGQTAVATLTVTELTQEAGAEQLADLLQELAETGAIHFVLDVQNVQYMDTACLGCLVEALNNLAQHGGRIALANSHHSVQYVFRLTRLDRVFRICPDVMSALEAVEGRREAG